MATVRPWRTKWNRLAIFAVVVAGLALLPAVFRPPSWLFLLIFGAWFLSLACSGYAKSRNYRGLQRVWRLILSLIAACLALGCFYDAFF